MCPQRRSALILFAVAWSLRIAAVLMVHYYLQHLAVPPRQFVIEGDADGYWQLAHQIVEGKPYQIYTPPRQVLRMPGFPLILAMSIRLFGDSLLAARLVLATIGALGCVGIYQLGMRLVGQRVGFIAGGLAAISPVFVGFSAIELTETAFAVSLVAGLLPLAPWARAEGPAVDANGRSAAIRAGIVAGLLAGVGCYLRPSWLLFPPCLVVWLWLLKRTSSRLLLAGCTVVFMVASLLPWAIRNQQVTGHFTLTTFWMGPSLYDGWNMQNTNGDSDMAFFDQENLMSKMSEYEMDREYRKRAWVFAFENPGRVAELAWKKTLRYWNPFPNADQFKSRRLLMVVSLVWYLVVFVPGVVGAWRLRRSLGVLAMTAGPILYFAALHLVFVSSVRYRLPGEYPMLILSAVGWEVLLLRGRFKRWLGPDNTAVI
jgi:4-amino-4-deoxy-L-arabinose transferase-like glycosyltransferase